MGNEIFRFKFCFIKRDLGMKYLFLLHSSLFRRCNFALNTIEFLQNMRYVFNRDDY